MRQATDTIIIQFLERNILSHFGFPQKIITENETAFKSKNMIYFCDKYHIILGHSTAYYPQGKRLAKFSNKSLVNIIKKLFQENKRNWHKKLINSLCPYRVSTKRSISMSPFQILYGVDTVFPTSLAASVKKILQEIDSDPNDIQ